jgi:hypothetical protein
MRRDVAEEIIRLVKKSDELFGGLSVVCGEIDDEAEKRKMRRALAELVHDVHVKITLDIVKQFPDLHPYKER